MKKHNNKPQVNVGENKRQTTRLRSVNTICFIKYCLPCFFFVFFFLFCFVFLMFKFHNLSV